MPIYCYTCHSCGANAEVYQRLGCNALQCECGRDMAKMPTFPSLVKNKGEGGYPSRQKFLKGTAPNTAGYRINPAGLDVKKE